MNLVTERVLAAGTALPLVVKAHPVLLPVCRANEPTVEGSLKKYLKYWYQIPRAMRLARFLGLHRSAPQTILDIGTGHGYFPYVCSSLGHRTVAVDVDWTPLYNDLTQALGIERIVHEIRGKQPLPALPAKFDLITAFMICFDGHKGKSESLWGVEQWQYFLHDLRRIAASGGARLVLSFNIEYDGTFYPKAVGEYFASIGASISQGGRWVELRIRPLE